MSIVILDNGDQLRLTADWTFTLHQESRNREFAQALGCMEPGTEWEAIMRRAMAITGENYHQTKPFPKDRLYYVERALASRLGHGRLSPLWMDALTPEDAETIRLMREYAVAVTVPAGVLLTVDRVYIRKGAKDFSSLSFLVSDAAPFGTRLAPVNKRGFKKAHRFWANIWDCRNIRAQVIYADRDH